MIEPELPIMLSFQSHRDSSNLVSALELAREQVLWEQRIQEDGIVVVTILNIINLEERGEREDLDAEI